MKKNKVTHYTPSEILDLMTTLKNVVPVSSSDWERVKKIHSGTWPDRSVESLRKRFQRLLKTNPPSGSTELPRELHIALEVRDMVVRKSNIAGDHEDDNPDYVCAGDNPESVDDSYEDDPDLFQKDDDEEFEGLLQSEVVEDNQVIVRPEISPNHVNSPFLSPTVPSMKKGKGSLLQEVILHQILLVLRIGWIRF